MCVILIADTKRPTEEVINSAFTANNAGAGIAWRENGFVKWEKGLNLADVTTMCALAPLPFVVHFRIPSSGDSRPQLCHPFPIEKNTSLALKGQTKGYVLFHNGHWTDWKKDVKEAAVLSNTPLPLGKWSDTRGMAFVASIYGLGILEMINEKTVAFGPLDLDVVSGTGWIPEDGVWYSNVYWKNRTHFKREPHEGPNYNCMCRSPKCSRYGTNSEGYCSVCQATREAEKNGHVTVHERKPADICTYGPCRRIDNLDADGHCPAHAVQNIESKGGDSTVIPFALAWELRAKGQLSNRKFKKARRAYEQACRDGKMNPLKGVALMEMVH